MEFLREEPAIAFCSAKTVSTLYSRKRATWKIPCFGHALDRFVGENNAFRRKNNRDN